MTIQTTTWTNDHCGCTISYDWDDSVPQDQRVHTVSTNPLVASLSKKCVDHQSIANAATHFNIVLDENQRKNIGLQTFIDNLSAQLSSTGSAGGQLKNGITYNFSFTGVAPNRVLNVSFSGITLTQAQKNAIQTAANNKFGTGKVVVS